MANENVQVNEVSIDNEGNLEEEIIESTSGESEDSLTFSNGVIEKIVSIACMQVEGVAGMKGGFFKRMQESITGANGPKGVDVEVASDGSVIINIEILMEYGAYAPDVFDRVKKAVVKQIKAMTGLEVSAVNLRIEDVAIPQALDDSQD